MTTHRMIAVVLDDVTLLDLAAPAHLFGDLGEGRYDFRLAAPEPGPVNTSSGFAVEVGSDLTALAEADTVVVPGYEPPDEPPDEPVLAALRDAAGRGARMISICTGAFALGHAGLLDGLRATTHWADVEAFEACFPDVEVLPDVLFVDEGQVLTSAGVAAGLDLCLHVLRRDHGADVATAMARNTVIAPHRDGGQAQFIDLPVPQPAEQSADLAATRAWALEHLGDDLAVDALAAHAMVSPRTFARRFRAETGTTPHRWILDQRIHRARRLLEISDMPIEQLAAECGFGSAASLRIHFRERTGTSPTAYRRTFAAA
jgi:transcriptional regulator GlxA family with amidase domain